MEKANSENKAKLVPRCVQTDVGRSEKGLLLTVAESSRNQKETMWKVP